MKKLIPLENLIKTRLGLNLTQGELAKRADLSRAMLSNIERGYALPSLPVAYRISKVLKKPIEYIFFNENARNMSRKQSA
ncbi:helix-turn-helix domain-containing protein [Brevibacillus laterosporus]|uniref:Helix-turn-helix domain-containing protein n=1 Tax=Brevibacillus laterosporus TaxID=1465 RepID=A0A518V4V7_BRELA|nr:helix-turn-helix domain-containing protein [Brevibacillus laterosporus]